MCVCIFIRMIKKSCGFNNRSVVTIEQQTNKFSRSMTLKVSSRVVSCEWGSPYVVCK